MNKIASRVYRDEGLVCNALKSGDYAIAKKREIHPFKLCTSASSFIQKILP